MPFSFDSKTLDRLRSSGVERVRVRLISGGCAGTKLSVETETPSKPGDEVFNMGGILVSVSQSDAERLSDAKIVWMEKNGKETWLLISKGIRERCGCGTSFSFGIPTKKLGALKALYAKNSPRTRIGEK